MLFMSRVSNPFKAQITPYLFSLWTLAKQNEGLVGPHSDRVSRLALKFFFYQIKCNYRVISLFTAIGQPHQEGLTR